MLARCRIYFAGVGNAPHVTSGHCVAFADREAASTAPVRCARVSRRVKPERRLAMRKLKLVGWGYEGDEISDAERQMVTSRMRE